MGPTIISSFGDLGAFDIAAFEHFFEVHLGHTAGGVARVVVIDRVDDQAVEHTRHLVGDFIQQFVQLAGFDELGDVVVGVEAFAGGVDALADFDGNRNAFVFGRGGRGSHGVWGFH
jgi:hypothetical protein